MESLSEYQPSLDQESESWAFFAMLTIEKVRGGIFTKPVENTNMTDWLYLQTINSTLLNTSKDGI